MAEKIEDLTVDYEENGELVVKELDKEILSKGAWTTILFRFKELDRKTGEYGPDRYIIRRYRKMSGVYKPQSKFKISSPAQARKIIDALARWVEETEAE
jgi:hypothetical protein